MSIQPEDQKKDNKDEKDKGQENFAINKFEQNKIRNEFFEFNQDYLDRVVKEMEDRRKKWLK